MIEQAENSGQLKPGEPSSKPPQAIPASRSAWWPTSKATKKVLVVPDKMSQEKIAHLKALGAQVIIARSDVQKGDPEYYQERAAALAASLENAIYIDQFSHPGNLSSHESTTGPKFGSS